MLVLLGEVMKLSIIGMKGCLSILAGLWLLFLIQQGYGVLCSIWTELAQWMLARVNKLKRYKVFIRDDYGRLIPARCESGGFNGGDRHPFHVPVRRTCLSRRVLQNLD